MEMSKLEKVIITLEEIKTQTAEIGLDSAVIAHEFIDKIISLLKEQDELLKHEYWRGYNNGRADERGLQEGTIMQTFDPN